VLNSSAKPGISRRLIDDLDNPPVRPGALQLETRKKGKRFFFFSAVIFFPSISQATEIDLTDRDGGQQ
jgi:hypothetical protein